MTENKSIEILAPCGSYESVEAAVRQGADAVYIGALRFSARAYAANFDKENLNRAIKYCRLHGVKVHMAINTLVSDEEIFAALDVARSAYKLGADAFIVQDLGLAALIKQACPNAVLHASTQMGVHTSEAARLLYKLGFERVVLAREMSKNEISEITKNCPAETEVFVHGALCMCMSGQCYLSAMLGGRSGNRGRCAQPCRLPFSVKNGTGYDLSLKDNSVIEELSELAQMGVTSAKIEGRMKRPEYVAAAVSACRQMCDGGTVNPEDMNRLKAVFSRSGFTNGYFYGHLGKDMFGTRSKDDVAAATDKVLAEIRTSYKNEIQTNTVKMQLIVCDGAPAVLTAECRGHTVCVDGEVPQYAHTAPLGKEKVISQLSKTGGTAFKVESTDVEIGEGLTLPISCLNKMRREALTQLEDLITQPPERELNEIENKSVVPHKRTGKLKYRASFGSCDIPDCFKKCEYVYVPLFSDLKDIGSLIERGFNVAAEIPRALFGSEQKAANALENIKKAGVTHTYCNNIGAAALAKKLGFKIHGGFALNLFNSEAVEFYNNDIGVDDTELSFELTAGQINKIGSNKKIGIVGYGYLPLMLTRNCPNKNGNGCKSCKGKSIITDRKGKNFVLMCGNGYTELHNSDVLNLSDKQEQFKNIDFMTLRFTFETKEECEKIFNYYLKGSKPVGDYTRGLYFRGVE